MQQTPVRVQARLRLPNTYTSAVAPAAYSAVVRVVTCQATDVLGTEGPSWSGVLRRLASDSTGMYFGDVLDGLAGYRGSDLALTPSRCR